MTVESGSPRNATSTVNPPAAIHWYSCLTNSRSGAGIPSSFIRSAIARMKDTVTAPAATQPAERPGHRRPVSSSATPATSGNRGRSGTRFTPSPPQEARVVDVDGTRLAIQRDDDREADDDLGRRDRHREERKH